LVTARAIVARCCLVLAFLAPAAPALAGKDGPAPIVVKEPHYGEILYYFYQEDYFPAIVRVLAAQEQGQLAAHAAEAELLKGGLYLSYGHHLEAADIFERLPRQGAARARQHRRRPARGRRARSEDAAGTAPDRRR
jgi:hypothetical protein